MFKIMCKYGLLVLPMILISCIANANPLIGTWEVASIKADDLITQFSIDRHKSLQPKEITFSEKEMSVLAREGERKDVAVEYKELGKELWAFSVDGKVWNEVIIQDKDTLIRKENNPEGSLFVYTLKRKQK